MTYQDDLRSTARIAGHPIHPMLVPVPIVCFVGALITDIAYFATAEMMWADFSAWLLTVGVIMGVLAAIAGLIDFLGNRLIRAQTPAWPHVLGNLLVLVLALVQHAAFTAATPGPRSSRPALILSAASSSSCCRSPAGSAGRWSTATASEWSDDAADLTAQRAGCDTGADARCRIFAGRLRRPAAAIPRPRSAPIPNLPALQQYPLPADAPCPRRRLEARARRRPCRRA